jgi:hypothetical protein
MRHLNSVFHTLLKLVPWHRFDRLVEKYEADAGTRKLTTKSQLAAMLYGQFAGIVSLRGIEAALLSHQARLYHIGVQPIRRSTLADANATRPYEVFAELFAEMVKQTHRGLRQKIGDAVRLIDSTSVRLNCLSSDWATFSAGVCGAKVHVVYDPAADRPLYFSITASNVNDITAAKAMPIEAGATYVFDLGYYDYGWWAKLDNAGCRIVTRLKVNTPLSVIEENKVAKDGGNIISDRIGFLPARLAKSRKNPIQVAVREIRVLIETGKVLRIVTNDLDAPAQEIADLYKTRWQIELFFRWVKQTLKIKHFIGVSENAIRIQIAIALIAFLLLRWAQDTQKAIRSPLEFARLVCANLMHRRPIDGLLHPDRPLPLNIHQLSLELCLG